MIRNHNIQNSARVESNSEVFLLKNEVIIDDLELDENEEASLKSNDDLKTILNFNDAKINEQDVYNLI